MFGSSLRAGLSALRRRPGLVLLLYGTDLALAFVLAVPLYSALSALVGPTGYSAEMAGAFDVVLWTDLMEKAGPVFRALGAQLVWMLLLYAVWKSAAGVALVYALRGAGRRSFWQGVSRFAGRGLLLSLAFVPLLVGLLLLLFLLALALDAAWQGEVAAFWQNFVVLPLLLVAGLVLLDLLHDYARLSLVVERQRVRRALGAGLRWPFRHATAFALYALWAAVAALLLFAPFLLDSAFTAGTAGGIWLLFLLQQLFLLLRAAATVGWVGSEVALFEGVRNQEALRLAAATPVFEDEPPLEALPEADTPLPTPDAPPVALAPASPPAPEEEARPAMLPPDPLTPA